MHAERREKMPGAEPAVEQHSTHNVGGIMRVVAEVGLLGIQRRNRMDGDLPGSAGVGDQPVDRRNQGLVAGRWGGVVHGRVSFETHRP